MPSIKAGLQLALGEDGADVVGSFTYHFCSSLGVLKAPNPKKPWIVLHRTVPAPAAYYQVALHELSVEDDPADLAYGWQGTKKVAAVVFICLTNSPPEELSPAPAGDGEASVNVSKKIKIPVLMVTKSDGQKILKLMERTILYSRIVLESSADGAAGTDNLEASAEGSEEAAAGTIYGGLLQRGGTAEKKQFPLSSSIARLCHLEPDKKSKKFANMCSTPDRFREVFQVFSDFERYFADERPSKFETSVKNTCQGLMEMMKATYLEDLPFHMLASWRMRWVHPYCVKEKASMTKIKEYFKLCWGQCIMKIDHGCIRKCFRPFLRISDELELPWGDVVGVSASERLHQCLVTYHLQRTREGLRKAADVKIHLCLCQIMLCLQPDKTIKDAQETWMRVIRCIQPLELPWSKDLMAIFQEQFNLSSSWQLPDDLRFDAHVLSALFSRYDVIDFQELLGIANGLISFMPLRDDTIGQLLVKLHAYISEALKQQQCSLDRFTRDNTVPSFLAGARDFLAYLLHKRNGLLVQRRTQQAKLSAVSSGAVSSGAVSSSAVAEVEEQPRSVQSNLAQQTDGDVQEAVMGTITVKAVSVLKATDIVAAENSAFLQWISMLVNCRFMVLALSDPQFPQYITEFLKDMPLTLSAMATAELSMLVTKRASTLSPDRLLSILSKFSWMSEEVGVAFLTDFRPQEDASFTTPTLWELLGLLVKNWPNIKHRILDLLKAVALSYHRRNKLAQVINDLLNLAIQLPMLLSDDGAAEEVVLSSDSEESDSDSDDEDHRGSSNSFMDSLGLCADSTLVVTSLDASRLESGRDLLAELTVFLVKDVIELHGLADTLRVNLPSAMDFIVDAERNNPLRDAVLDALVEALPPNANLLLNWKGTRAREARVATDGAQAFLGMTHSLLINAANTVVPAAIGGDWESPSLRFLWRILCACADHVPVEELRIGHLPNLQNLSVTYHRFVRGDRCFVGAVGLSDWFARLKLWARRLHDDIMEGNITQERLKVCLGNIKNLSVFYGHLGLASLNISAGVLKEKLLEFESLELTADEMLVRRPLEGGDEDKVYWVKQLLSNYNVRIEPSVETEISKCVILPEWQSKIARRATLRRDRANTGAAHALNSPAAAAAAAPPAQGPADTSSEGNATTADKVQVRFTSATTLKAAAEFVRSTHDWIAPVFECLDLLVFFHHRDSSLFSAFLQEELNSVILQRASAAAAVTPESTFSINSMFSIHSATLPSMPGQLPEPEEGYSLEEFSGALRATQDWLYRFVTNEAKLSDIFIITQDRFHAVNVQQEFDALVEFRPFQLAKDSGQGSSGGAIKDVFANVRSMLELLNYSGVLTTIVNVCDLYQLKGCLADPQFKEVQRLAEQLSKREFFETLNSGRASEMAAELSRVLSGATLHNLQIFTVIQDCVDFGTIIRDHKFDQPQGKANFESQVKLIMHQIESEEYNDTVLNHLTASFDYMLPFVNAKAGFSSLMRKVKDWQPDIIQHAMNQLRTVQSNIEMVKFWFSRAQGATLENVVYELEDILSSGKYCFIFGAPREDKLPLAEDMTKDQRSAILSNPSAMHLVYRVGSARPAPEPGAPPHASLARTSDVGFGSISPSHSVAAVVGARARQSATVASTDSDHNVSSLSTTVSDDIRRIALRFGGAGDPSAPAAAAAATNPARPRVAVRVLSAEDIDDFVRRLGFVEAGSNLTHQPKIKDFVARNQVVREEFAVCQKLALLGYPNFNDVSRSPGVGTESSGSAPDEQLNSLKLYLAKWSDKVAELREQFPLLVFFSVQQTLAISELVKVEAEYLQFNGLIHYIGQLYLTGPDVWRNLSRVFSHISDKLYEGLLATTLRSASPMEKVGHFLRVLSSELGEEEENPICLLPGKKSAGSMDAALDGDHRCVLHVPAHPAPTDLLRVLLAIFRSLPHSFQVLRCQNTTTEEQLELFLKKASLYVNGTFVLLEVNKLSSALQEYLLSTQLEHHTAHTAAEARGRQPKRRGQLHCLESGKSMLQDVPWVRTLRHQGKVLADGECRKACDLGTDTFCSVHLVYGEAGAGKSHFIKRQIEKRGGPQLTIAVNESFTAAAAIEKLKDMPMRRDACVYFNVGVIVQPSATDAEEAAYVSLLAQFHWFLLGLVGFRCVTDDVTGTLFRVPGGMSWSVYVEVPSQLSSRNAQSDLEEFLVHVPILRYLSQWHYISPEEPYDLDVDKNFQVVAKYLHAYKNNTIDDIHEDFGLSMDAVKISARVDIGAEECQALLREFTPDHLRKRKILQRLFVRYMLRRCLVLENMPAFIYNTGVGEQCGPEGCTNTWELGSTLMRAMLKETQQFCNPDVSGQFEAQSHEQLIYEMKSGCHTVQLLSTKPYLINAVDRARYEAIGVSIPNELKLSDRATLDSYLSCALDVPLENNRLAAIDEEDYVLTLDYTVKMLAIHERRMCGVPVVIEGETGVGKTALLHMLSLLWNRAAQSCRKRVVKDLTDVLIAPLSSDTGPDPGRVTELLDFVHEFAKGKPISREQVVEHVMMGREDTMPQACHAILTILALLQLPSACLIQVDEDLLDAVLDKGSFAEPEDFVALLLSFFNAPMTKTFYKLKIHAALTAAQLKSELHAIFKKARELIRSVELRSTKEALRLMSTLPHAVVTSHEAAVFTVFLDEVNTTSCIGLFKELLVDKTLDGKPIPSNVFLVAACNPHRSSSVAVSSHAPRDWVLGSYQVHAIPPSLRCLCWNYGALTGIQEEEYIRRKIATIGRTDVGISVQQLSLLVSTSQCIMREFAEQQLGREFPPDEAKLRATSCVSQRDIQRVFTLAKFFDRSLRKDKQLAASSRAPAAASTMATTTTTTTTATTAGRSRFFSMFSNWNQSAEPATDAGGSHLPSREALLLALGLVYYLRLDTIFRHSFSQKLTDLEPEGCGDTFLSIFYGEMDKYMDHLSIPTGIAKTRALKENIFATIVCSVLHLPLIIVGAPGSSKTLSFNLAVENLRGLDSPGGYFRDTDRFPALDPQFYQCSRKSTSVEIENVFQRTINRQKSHQQNRLDRNCVVFMDEAGLPEDGHESLKALHYYLDKPEVSFVAITNRILDAAKTNRGISLFRPDPDENDLRTLADGCMCQDPEHPPPHLQATMKLLNGFCMVYRALMRDQRYSSFFGLRDFIHFIHYIRRSLRDEQEITPHIVMRGLERNFNGVDQRDFAEMARMFLKQMGVESLRDVEQRSVVDILKESLEDQPMVLFHQENHLVEDAEELQNSLACDQVRYKLIIDESEDDSMTRLLFHYNILDAAQTRCFTCSDFTGDSDMQQINLVSSIRHAALEGTTAVLSESDAINESFYDLFNQRFRHLADPTQGIRYFANIAIGSHSKLSRVDPSFQCVVHVRAAELESAPLPFLNRFEKYRLAQGDLLAFVLKDLPPSMKEVIVLAMSKVRQFVRVIGSEHFASYTEETVTSLFIDFLPLPGHKLYKQQEDDAVDDDDEADGDPAAGHGAGDAAFSADVEKSRMLCFEAFESVMRSGAGFRFSELSDSHRALMFKELLSLGLSMEPIMSKSMLEADLQFPKHFRRNTLEALAHLYTTSPAGTYTGSEECESVVFGNGCRFITAVILEWIVMRMTTRLLQLLRPEVLILKKSLLPAWVLETYVQQQSHFNLKDLLTEKVNLLNSSESESGVHNKLVVFTRTKPQLHRIAHSWPVDDASAVAGGSTAAALQDLVFDNLDKLVLAKLDHIHTEEQMKTMMQHFIESDTQEIMVFVANTANCSRQRINHLRLTIEDEERRSSLALSRAVSPGGKRRCRKLFVVLLHSTAARLHGHSSYPALFLLDWDHHYLEHVSHAAAPSSVDVLKLMQLTCLPSAPVGLTASYAPLLRYSIAEQIPAALLVVVSRIMFGSCRNGRLNRCMTARDRCVLLAEVLSSKYQLCRVVCGRIARYWDGQVLASQLHATAELLKSHEDSSSLTEKLADIFAGVVQNVLTVIVSKLNEHFNLEVLSAGLSFSGISSSNSNGNGGAHVTVDSGDAAVQSAVMDMFCAVTEALPLPSYNNIKSMNHMIDMRLPRHLAPPPPSFPFFHRVWTGIAKLLQQVVAEQHRKLSGSAAATGGVGDDELLSSSDSQQRLEERVAAALYDRLLQLEHEPASDKSPLIAYQQIANNSRLWDLYLSDFIRQRLHISSGTAERARSSNPGTGLDLERLLVSVFLEGLNTVQPVENRLILLHILSHFRLQALSKLSQSLRPLAALQYLPQQAADSPKPSAAPARQLEARLIVFLVSTLHSSLLSFIHDQQPVDHRNLYQWQKAYTSVLQSMPHLLYTSSLLSEQRAQLNVCAVVSAFLSVVQVRDEQVHCVVHLVMALRVAVGQPMCLSLADAVYHGVETMLELNAGSAHQLPSPMSGHARVLPEDLHPLVKSGALFVQLLLQHYFPTLPVAFTMHSAVYTDADCLWLLRSINSSQVLMSDPEWSVVDRPSQSMLLFPSAVSQSGSNGAELCRELVQASCAKLFTPAMAEYWTQQLLLVAQRGEELQDTLRGNLETVLMYSQRDSFTRFVPQFYDQPYIREACSTLSVNSSLLAESYFSCRLFQLMSTLQNIRLPHLMTKLRKLESPLTYVQDIEYQATLQVVLCKLADCIGDYALGTASGQREGLRLLFTADLIAVVNKCILDERTGGGQAGGHSYVLLSRLLQKLHSSQRLIRLLTGDQLHTLMEEFRPFLRPFIDELKHPIEMYCHLMPFAYPSSSPPLLGVIYNTLVDHASDIIDHASHYRGKDEGEAVEHFVRALRDPLSDALSDEVMPLACQLRMLLWYCIYHCFYQRKHTSARLAAAIHEDMAAFLELQPCQVALLLAFMDPSRMFQRPEVLNPTNANEVRLELQPNGRVQRRRLANDQELDSLWQLFDPQLPQDSDDAQLRNALANLIAAVMGMPAGSTHLWAHMFNGGSLAGTFVTGNMYPNKVSAQGLQYDCGCELSADGDYGRPDYATHGARGNLTLPSRYLMLWANFGAFCVSLLTQDNAYESLCGPVISDWQSLRHYCISQVRTTWLLMRSNLNFNDEERSFFIAQAMTHLQKNGPQLFGQPVFNNLESLNRAEAAWHTGVFEPSIEACQNPTVVDDAVWQNHPFLLKLRDFENIYPRRVSSKLFYHAVEQYQRQHVATSASSPSPRWSPVPSSSSSSSSAPVSVAAAAAVHKTDALQHVLVWRRRLHIGGMLLPDLVEFYAWTHSMLAYAVTFDQAASYSIGQVLDKLPERYDRRTGEHMRQLFDRLCLRFNVYVDFCGGAIGHGACAAVHRENALEKLSRDTKLLSLLSDAREEGQGNDVLFVVLKQLVDTHNQFLDVLSTLLPDGTSASLRNDDSSSRMSLYSRLRAELHDNRLIQPLEVASQTCLLGDVTALELDECLRNGVGQLPSEEELEFLRIVRRHFTSPATAVMDSLPLGCQSLTASLFMSRSSGSGSGSGGGSASAFDMASIEQDVLLTYVLGKARIADPSCMRIVFNFREVPIARVAGEPAADEPVALVEVDGLDSHLPSDFTAPLSAEMLQTVGLLSHDLDSVVTKDCLMMLLTVLGHVRQIMLQLTHPLAAAQEDGDDDEETAGQGSNAAAKGSGSLLQFLTPLLCSGAPSGSVVDELAHQLAAKRVPRRMLEHLFSLQLCKVVPCIRFFHSRLLSGECQYSHLPMRVKSPLPADLSERLRTEISSAYSDAAPCTLELDISLLLSALSEFESRLIQQHDLCIRGFLVTNRIYSDTELPVSMFPPGQLGVEYYVALRQLLTRLKLEVGGHGGGDSSPAQHQQEPWTPHMTELWDRLSGWHGDVPGAQLEAPSRPGLPKYHLVGGAMQAVFWDEGSDDDDDNTVLTPGLESSLDDNWLGPPQTASDSAAGTAGNKDTLLPGMAGAGAGGRGEGSLDYEDDMDSSFAILSSGGWSMDKSLIRSSLDDDDNDDDEDDDEDDEDDDDDYGAESGSVEWDAPSPSPAVLSPAELDDEDVDVESSFIVIGSDNASLQSDDAVPEEPASEAAAAAVVVGDASHTPPLSSPMTISAASAVGELSLGVAQSMLPFPSPSPATLALSPALMETLRNAEILKMSVDDVSGWLKSIGLDKYVASFAAQDVDGSILAEMDDATLKELGVDRGLERKRILGQLQRLRLSSLQQPITPQ